MKIVDYRTFVRMPAGTIFASYEPCVFGDFQIKTDTGHFKTRDEWGFLGIMPLAPYFIDDDHLAFGPGKFEIEQAIYDIGDADYDEYGLFAILELHEVKQLINTLHWALAGCPVGYENFCKARETVCEVYMDIVGDYMRRIKENNDNGTSEKV